MTRCCSSNDPAIGRLLPQPDRAATPLSWPPTGRADSRLPSPNSRTSCCWTSACPTWMDGGADDAARSARCSHRDTLGMTTARSWRRWTPAPTTTWSNRSAANSSPHVRAVLRHAASGSAGGRVTWANWRSTPPRGSAPGGSATRPVRKSLTCSGSLRPGGSVDQAGDAGRGVGAAVRRRPDGRRAPELAAAPKLGDRSRARYLHTVRGVRSAVAPGTHDAPSGHRSGAVISTAIVASLVIPLLMVLPSPDRRMDVASQQANRRRWSSQPPRIRSSRRCCAVGSATATAVVLVDGNLVGATWPEVHTDAATGAPTTARRSRCATRPAGRCTSRFSSTAASSWSGRP